MQALENSGGHYVTRQQDCIVVPSKERHSFDLSSALLLLLFVVHIFVGRGYR